MRKKSLYLLALTMSISAAMAQQTVVSVHQADGTVTERVLGQEGVITFGADGENLVVKGVQGTFNFALSDVKKVTFGEDELSLSQQEQPRLTLYPNPTQGAMHVSGVGNKPQQAAVFSMAGTKMMEQTVNDGSLINIEKLPAGIYFVRCGKQVIKVCKQR